ncbi:delta-like protein 4 [Lingula anatina]|uniref:Delta-like protein 4 n=1 Tax=Lingula anatina TaxID=7574 RepID=A0A1S3HWB8_LINAN|nr:delta-like protein 4 [Lingula anatina]|eukprot:XP_013390330.1 delta-like protein 4 [Lingula anatina]
MMGLLFCPSLVLALIACVFLSQTHLSLTFGCESNSCYNGGFCDDKPDDQSGFHCICFDKHFGERCELRNCKWGYCFNGATCATNTTNSKQLCICPEGCNGKMCEIAQCGENAHCQYKPHKIPLPGKNDSCNALNHEGCVCNEGYSGDGINCTADGVFDYVFDH